MRLDPRWLVAAAPRGIVCARGGREVVLGLHAPFDTLVELLGALDGEAEDAARVAGTSPDEAAHALATLREHGVLSPTEEGPAPPPEGVPRVEAILTVLAGAEVGAAWTADEVLVLPDGAGPDASRRAVRAFVAALLPDARLEAYAAVATHRQRSVRGDVPDAEAVARAIASARAADPAAVHAVRLREGRTWSLAVDDLDRLGMREPHRLGPLQGVRRVPAGPPLAGRRASFSAEYAVGNLASPWPRAFRVGRGTLASPERAELTARAEAAERFGAYEVDPARLRRATAAELDGEAVRPDVLQRFSPRQYAEHDDLAPYDPDRAILWIRGATTAGEPRWVPAQAVHVGLAADEGPAAVISSSSGLAAGASAPDAAHRALLEVIERDAFMWTWVQRVSRERVDLAGLEPEPAALARAIEAMGYEVELVNLTLDTKPVIVSVLHREDRIHVAAACRESAHEAAAKALDETALVLALEHPHEPFDMHPQQVQTPEDHMWLHLHRDAVERAAFLWASTDTIDLREVASVADPVVRAVAGVGEPVVVDLSSPRTAPFHVARALVPEMVPMSFGWDREPLGMPRLSVPARTVDGRTLGARIALDETAPILPHPFP